MHCKGSDFPNFFIYQRDHIGNAAATINGWQFRSKLSLQLTRVSNAVRVAYN